MEYLYHYTTIASLESILRNQTIRFRSLSTMDDVEEAMAKDSKAFGNFVFVSSWSGTSQEMIPMWSMYSKEGHGVRIGLPVFPFVEYRYTPEDQRKLNMSDIDGDIVTDIPIEDTFFSPFSVIPYHKENIIVKVEYTNNQALIDPSLWATDNTGVSFDPNSMGKYKNEYWRFQNEVRYRLMVFPFSVSGVNALMQSNNTSIVLELFKRVSNGDLALPFSFYDMKIAPEALRKMEITLGPLMTDGEKKCVTELIHDIEPEITVEASNLTGKWRGKAAVV